VRNLWILITTVIIAGAIVMALSRSPGTPSSSGDVAMSPRVDNEPTRTETIEQPAAAATDDLIAEELASSLGADAEARVEAAKDATDTEAPAPTDDGSASITDGLDVEIAHATVLPGNIRPGPDNDLLVDDEWTLTGKGTRDDPYEPSWEYLYSAADTYQPRLDENEIPQRIALLNDKWVRIAGYTAIPLVVGETTEMLVMLNKWDGCCIGVPPTPFDAIEVHLTSPVVRKSDHSFNYGTLTGRMKVDPYLIENWLVGLYILEESTLVKDL
jgi:hypothetical protein